MRRTHTQALDENDFLRVLSLRGHPVCNLQDSANPCATSYFGTYTAEGKYELLLALCMDGCLLGCLLEGLVEILLDILDVFQTD